MACLVKQIENITEHPFNNNFDMVSVKGVSVIVNKGQYKIKEAVIYIPENTLLPQPVLEKLSLWDVVNQKGMLSGEKGDVVSIETIDNINSYGILYPLKHCSFDGNMPSGIAGVELILALPEPFAIKNTMLLYKEFIQTEYFKAVHVAINQDVSAYLQINS